MSALSIVVQEIKVSIQYATNILWPNAICTATQSIQASWYCGIMSWQLTGVATEPSLSRFATWRYNGWKLAAFSAYYIFIHDSLTTGGNVSGVMLKSACRLCADMINTSIILMISLGPRTLGSNSMWAVLVERATTALVTPSMPISVCSILRKEEVNPPTCTILNQYWKQYNRNTN